MMTYFKSALAIGRCVGTLRVGVASEAIAYGDRLLLGCRQSCMHNLWPAWEQRSINCAVVAE